MVKPSLSLSLSLFSAVNCWVDAHGCLRDFGLKPWAGGGGGGRGQRSPGAGNSCFKYICNYLTYAGLWAKYFSSIFYVFFHFFFGGGEGHLLSLFGSGHFNSFCCETKFAQHCASAVHTYHWSCVGQCPTVGIIWICYVLCTYTPA